MHDSLDLQARLTDLELLFTHLQRDVGEMNRVLIQQQKTIESLRRELSSMQARHRLLGPAPEGEIDPDDGLA
jgi:uncharacterized coiled-coil protein SlyX